MRYFLCGIIAGLVIALSPVFMEKQALSIYPEWTCDLTTPASTIKSADSDLSKNLSLTEIVGESILIFNTDGALSKKISIPRDTLISASGNGEFYASYKKVGEEIEFSKITGERFWKIPSKEYPYVSPNAKLVLLLVADLSNLRIFDNNANPMGVQNLSGRMCSAITFSQKTDHAAAGFIDGTVSVIDNKGSLLYRGKAPSGAIKSAALSSNGSFLAAHYGNTDKDGILVVNIEKKKEYAFNLPSRHLVKTALAVNDDGDVSILNNNALILCTKKGDVISRIQVPSQRPGHAVIKEFENIYALSYRKEEGGTMLLVFNSEGSAMLRRDFQNEPYLDCKFTGNILTARGQGSLYAWRIEKPE